MARACFCRSVSARLKLRPAASLRSTASESPAASPSSIPGRREEDEEEAEDEEDGVAGETEGGGARETALSR